ncbi:hypothetical protein BHF71_07020 [Vulcanibacillus modesticaldus]|uniref:Metallo-beta-lactamase domain-containing protein n=1 Tax=Vulcanibacillus modesticaldus TaxID=337097 RepID=A0A1D2YW74_9BACI|nr:MBL fold metallo-hydrolase [Vulcanibacillus modesticaldus]OEF99941.1 hypothetical protein BHF71_07020 [Vulcanibacillus modesticaldus]
MKVTIVGTWGAYPEVNSATSSILVEEGGFNLLVDCGSGVLSQLQNHISLSQLDGLIVSHYHNDHIADIGCLQYYFLIQNQSGKISKLPFPIYGHNNDSNAFNKLTFNNITMGYEISENSTINIGPFQVSFCPTVHPVYGLSIKFKVHDKVLIYTGDTEWTDQLVEFSKDADVLICEANLYNEQLGKVKGHLTAGQAGELAEIAGVNQLILTHLPHDNNHHLLVEQAKERFNGDVKLAKPGLVINL